MHCYFFFLSQSFVIVRFNALKATSVIYLSQRPDVSASTEAADSAAERPPARTSPRSPSASSAIAWLLSSAVMLSIRCRALCSATLLLVAARRAAVAGDGGGDGGRPPRRSSRSRAVRSRLRWFRRSYRARRTASWSGWVAVGGWLPCSASLARSSFHSCCSVEVISWAASQTWLHCDGLCSMWSTKLSGVTGEAKPSPRNCCRTSANRGHSKKTCSADSGTPGHRRQSGDDVNPILHRYSRKNPCPDKICDKWKVTSPCFRDCHALTSSITRCVHRV